MTLPANIHVLERGWLSANNVLLLGRETAIIDTGYVTHAPQTLALVEHVLQGRALDLVLNTHLHSDHCGGNAALQARYGSRTLIPAAEADKVRDWDEAALSFRALGQQCARFAFDGTLTSGDTLELGDFTWQVLAAPGHHPPSLVFYCPEERILISGDAFWENGFGVVFPEMAGEPGFDDVRATLEMIAALDVRLVIPGHGTPFTDFTKALDNAWSRLAYLSADPVRNAQLGVKVLLKFLLLERQQIPLAELPALLADIPIVRETNRRYLGKDDQILAEWAVAQLVRATAADVRGRMLINL